MSLPEKLDKSRSTLQQEQPAFQNKEREVDKAVTDHNSGFAAVAQLGGGGYQGCSAIRGDRGSLHVHGLFGREEAGEAAIAFRMQ